MSFREWKKPEARVPGIVNLDHSPETQRIANKKVRSMLEDYWVTTQEYASKCGETPGWVQVKIRRGLIPAVKRYSTWHIPVWCLGNGNGSSYQVDGWPFEWKPPPAVCGRLVGRGCSRRRVCPPNRGCSPWTRWEIGRA